MILIFVHFFAIFGICVDKEPKKEESVIGFSNNILPDVSTFHDSDECDGINTIKKGKECLCVPGFLFGDPYSKQGCFKCIDQCNESAKCVWPGRCKCNDGLFGDGVTFCTVPTPVIDESQFGDLFIVQSGELINISFRRIPRFTPKTMYIKFGEKAVILGKLLNSTAVQCETPKLESGTYSLFLSFDNLTWSQKNIFVTFIDNTENNRITFNLKSGAIVGVVILILVVAYHIIFNKVISAPAQGSLLDSDESAKLTDVPLQKSPANRL